MEAQFKNYPDLLLAYGIDDDTKIDQRWRDFLRKTGDYVRPPGTQPTAGKFTMVTNYNASTGTFDTLWIEPKPQIITFGANGSTPTDGLATPTPHTVTIPLSVGDPVHMVSPFGEERRYCDNMPLRVLDNIIRMNTEEHIYCTDPACGYQVELESRYDNMPEFSWRELFDPAVYAVSKTKNLVYTGASYVPTEPPILDRTDPIQAPYDGSTPPVSHPITSPASTVNFSPVKDGLIFCPACRSYTPFATIESSIVTSLVLLPPTPISLIPEAATLPLEHVLARSVPSIITDFSATENQLNQITFKWSHNPMGYPTPTYELHDSTGLLEERINSGYILEVTGTETYHVIAVNTTFDTAGLEVLNEILSNTDSGEGLTALTVPSAITDFTATTAEEDQITFTWSEATGYPAPSYELYDANGIVAVGVDSPLTITDASAGLYHVFAINSEGSTPSNSSAGDFV